MINSLITATVKHTKVRHTPNKLGLLPIIGKQPPIDYWSGVTHHFILQPQYNEIPVYYLDVVTPPTLTISDLDPTEYSVELIGAKESTNWDLSEDPCTSSSTGCYEISIFTNISGGETRDVFDECDNKYTLDIPTTKISDIDISMENNINTVGATLSAANFHSLEDPYKMVLTNQEVRYLSHAKEFDMEDYYGNGVVFTNPESVTSSLLSAIFDDPFTGDINEKIANYVDNIVDIDLADLGAVDDLGEMIGIPDSGYSQNLPKELVDVMKIASIKYEDIFGQEDHSIMFSDDNVGELLDASSYISAGDILFTRPFDEPEASYSHFITQTLSELSSLDSGVFSGDDYYQLSSMNHPIYNINDHCFWKSKGYTVDGRTKSLVNLETLTHIPTKEEWYRLISLRIEYLLNKNILVD